MILLSDVIGAVQQVVRTQVSSAGKKACVNLTLSDECGTEMDVTLWKAYANQFMNFATKNGHVFLILTHAWCRQSLGFVKLFLSKYRVVITLE
ncbi:hypothetical protein RYX36_015787 [Vicia faba]